MVLPLSKWFSELLNDSSEAVKIEDAYRSVFSTVKGRMVLEHICMLGGVDKTSFTPGDGSTTTFLEGQRRLALEILSRAHADPVKMLVNEEYFDVDK